MVALSLPHSKQWEACWRYVMGVVDLAAVPTGRGSSLAEDPGSSLDVAGRADTRAPATTSSTTPRHGGSTATCVHSWWKRWWCSTRRDRRWRRSPSALAFTTPRWRGTSSRQERRCAPTQPPLPSKSGCGRLTARDG